MSTVLDSAAPVATPAVDAPQSAPASTETVSTTESTQQAPERTGSYQERATRLRGEARAHYRLTGDLDAAEAKQIKRSDAPAASSPASEEPGTPSEAQARQGAASKDVQTEPASGTGEPKPTRQDRDWSNLRKKAADQEREITAYKAKLEVYERERAGSGTSAPAAPKEAPKPPASEVRPQFPDINAFNDPKEFQKAVNAWQAKDSEWVDRQMDQRFSGEKARQHQEQSMREWSTQIDTAKTIHKDFEAVAFNPQVPVSYATLGEIQTMSDGALRSYALGKNLAEATRIAELTHLPGEAQFKSFAEFMRWVHSDPRVAMLYGEKRALAKLELQKLTVGKAPQPKPATPSTPLKEMIAQQNRPSAEVDVEENAAPVTDPIANAIKRAKETGDNREYSRLMNQQDLQRRKRS